MAQESGPPCSVEEVEALLSLATAYGCQWMSIPGVIAFQLSPRVHYTPTEPETPETPSMDNVVEKKSRRKPNPLLKHPKLGL